MISDLLTLADAWRKEAARLYKLSEEERSEVMHYAYRHESLALEACAQELMKLVRLEV